MDGLPLLPGFHFNDVTQIQHNLSSQFRWKNGYALPKDKSIGIGNKVLDVDSILYATTPEASCFNPTLTYGLAKDPPKPMIQSNFLKLDGKCLSFLGYTKQTVLESPTGTCIVRHVKIIYFLVDDTISVVEPVVKNAGYVQGKLLRRDRIPNPNRKNRYWHWSDFNNGVELSFHGIAYRLCSCDEYTKRFLSKQGVFMNPEESLPEDLYTVERREIDSLQPPEELCRKFIRDDKYRQFLDNDKKVLRFYALWKDWGSGIAVWKYYVLYYFLAYDVIEIHESKDAKRCGNSTFPLFLGKTKLPKHWARSPYDNPIYLEYEHQACYKAKHLVIGKTISVMGRRFLLYDCDQFTREHYKEILNIRQPKPCPTNDPNDEPPPIYEKEIPPHTGIGDPADTLQNCLSLRPKPPMTIDFVTYVLDATKKLRYRLKLVPVNPVDKYRNFIMEFCLGNDYISIAEVPSENSGFTKGRFVSSVRLIKPGTIPDDNQHYGTKDLAIGTELHVRGSVFTIVEMDLWTFKYMKENADLFPQNAIAEAETYFERKALGDDVNKNLYIKKQNIITLEIYN